MKYIKSFDNATDMIDYAETAPGKKSYLFMNNAGTDGIGTTLNSGKKIILYRKPQYDYLTFKAEQAGSTVKINSFNSLTSAEYSTDGGINWNNASGVTVTLANIGDKVKFRGVVKSSNSFPGTFSMTGKISAIGSIMSMYNNNPDDDTISIKNAFRCMFLGCTSLVSAENLQLPVMTLYESCYQSMFQGCTSLVSAPELPATTLASYCYQTMFQGCTSLVSAPILPATTLAGSCYYSMFQDCTSLTTAPELPATTLTNSCYRQMFQGCTSLVSAPILPATTLAGSCYYSMFQDCTSLTTAPELPATTLTNSCYRQMFQDCSFLSDVTIHITGTYWNTSNADNWLSGTAASGTIHNLGGCTNIPSDSNSGCPTGWTLSAN